MKNVVTIDVDKYIKLVEDRTVFEATVKKLEKENKRLSIVCRCLKKDLLASEEEAEYLRVKLDIESKSSLHWYRECTAVKSELEKLKGEGGIQSGMDT